ncbi:SAUGI family uracil-DNA glycosylase inhibitor [Staphylococcus epidermidis]|uniref:SAUGI family uracil-DNA glycosylase inhibitor n=1 Tax=Staphylococcus epidermidis TaxID=1282 RepID=UPI0037D9F456
MYPFLIYPNNQLITIRYLHHFHMHFLYLTHTQNIIIHQPHLLKQPPHNHQ